MSTAPSPPVRRRPRWLRWFVVALLVLPMLEIFAIIAVGNVLGTPLTFALLIADSILGAYLVRREGTKSWFALRDALNRGEIPARELSDAALVLVGGTLLLTPGFITDAIGFTLIFPGTRFIARGWLQVFISQRLIPVPLQQASRARAATNPRWDNADDVVEGEIVD